MRLRRFLAAGALASVLGGATAAGAVTLFENPWTAASLNLGSRWCSPCTAKTHDFQVYDKFTLGTDARLTSATWVSYNDAKTTDVLVAIYDATRTVQLFSQIVAEAAIGEVPVIGNLNNIEMTLGIPNWVLGAGDYWITFFGTTGKNVFRGQKIGGDSSLIQIFASGMIAQRPDDGAFRLNGDSLAVVTPPPTPAPLPASAPFAVTGIGMLALIRLRAQRRKATRRPH